MGKAGEEDLGEMLTKYIWMLGVFYISVFYIVQCNIMHGSINDTLSIKPPPHTPSPPDPYTAQPHPKSKTKKKKKENHLHYIVIALLLHFLSHDLSPLG